MDFLKKLVSRYKDRVKYWQIENEVYGAVKKKEHPADFPPLNRFWLGTKQEYLELLKESYTTIKTLDPAAHVLPGGIAFGAGPDLSRLPYDFFDYVFRGGREYFDIIDLHLYGDVNRVKDKIDLVKTKLAEFGYSKPLWCTEAGEIDTRIHKQFTTAFDSPLELALQAEEIVKKHVIAFANGIQAVLRLRLIPYRDNELGDVNWNHMSLTFDTQAHDKKPGFYTYKLMVSTLKNFLTAKELQPGIYKFTFADRPPVYVLWNDEGPTAADMSQYISAAKIKITKIITIRGATQGRVSITAHKEVAFDTTPVFIEEN